MAPAPWGGREPSLPPGLVGWEAYLGGVRGAGVRVLTPPLSSEGLHPTLHRELPRLVGADGNPSV